MLLTFTVLQMLEVIVEVEGIDSPPLSASDDGTANISVLQS